MPTSFRTGTFSFFPSPLADAVLLVPLFPLPDAMQKKEYHHHPLFHASNSTFHATVPVDGTSTNYLLLLSSSFYSVSRSRILKRTLSALPCPAHSASCLVEIPPARTLVKSFRTWRRNNMAALVQTIPQQSGTVPVLQTRPSSSSSAFASSSQTSGSRYQTMSWSSFNAGNSGTYRSGQPIAGPYTFAPTLGHSTSPQHRQSWSPHIRPEHRTFSAPTIPQGPMNAPYAGSNLRLSHPAAGSVTTSTSANSSYRSYVSKDDSAIPSRQPRSEQPLRPLSTTNISPVSVMNISSPSGSAKPSPNRYRRSNQRADAARSQSPAPASVSTADDPASSRPPTRPVLLRSNVHARVSSVDDASRAERPQPELAKRYRRRSLGTMDPSTYPNLQIQFPVSSSPPSGPYDFITFDSNRPHSAHSRRGSSGSVHSTRSSASSVSIGSSIWRVNVTNSSVSQAQDGTSPDSSSLASKSGRSEDKRTTKPSPLSQPASVSPAAPTTEAEETQSSKTPASPTMDSPAAKRLQELKNEPKRPGKSRLRRAFSFGSASELLKTSETRAAKREAIAAEKARQEALLEELGPEQAAIAMQQEESGLGESIYSHQGSIFSRSTDALSVSSTASSASMMLRKMGKGMKKSGRSLVGLFRPKSVASINSIEGATAEAPVAAPQITVVNVERDGVESVAVNSDPADLPRGGTVFPRVESGSEPRRSTSIRERNVSDSSLSRKSIVGGDRERAEVLAAVRKGILKSMFWCRWPHPLWL